MNIPKNSVWSIFFYVKNGAHGACVKLLRLYQSNLRLFRFMLMTFILHIKKLFH
jgi:hypothetical protein